MSTPSQTVDVSDTSQLIDAIQTANGSNNASITINLNAGFGLTQDLPAIALGAGTNLTIQNNTAGSTVTLDGGGKFRGLTVLNGSVSITNVVFNDMTSSGATSCMGAGGGLFVANTTNIPGATTYAPVVTLSGVSFTGCSATGGNGWAAPGGIGGNPNNPLWIECRGQKGNRGYWASHFIDWFGNEAARGNFGIAGRPTGPGTGGFASFNEKPARPGMSVRGKGHQSGYGAGGSGGGSGGGGGAGLPYHPADCLNGASGGNGGAGGPNGFGGGSPGQAESGQSGETGTYTTGANGGNGGNGAISGGGAGFGGGIFLMDNANVTISGAGSMSNTATGGNPNGSAAGQDIFLQGSGTLTFNIQNGQTYTIGEISDEAGSGITSVASGTGPDQMPYGGGSGTWNISQNGSGTLTINSGLSVTGNIVLDDGALDLSECQVAAKARIHLNSGSLVYTPNRKQEALSLTQLTLTAKSTLKLNGNSHLIIEKLEHSDRFKIELDSKGFEPGKEITLITSKEPIDPKSTIDFPSHYRLRISGASLSVTM